MISMYCRDCDTARPLQRQLLLTTASITFLLLAGASRACAQQIIFDGVVEPGDPAHIDGNTDLYVGTTASGRLSILDGATMTTGQGIVGENSPGEVVVSGSDSRWHSTSWIRVGVVSEGRIELADGGAAESVLAVIGETARGEVLMTSGASLTVSDQLVVGLIAEGELRVEGGAQIVSNQGYVGANPGGIGNVTVTGAGSTWRMTGSNLSLGNYGVGAMTIEDGANVYALSGVELGTFDAAASGTMTILGTVGARGVLETSMIRAGAGTANVMIDGGILRAISDNHIFFHNFAEGQVQLGSHGGHFDTNGHDIGVSTVLTGPGALIKDGSGTLTLTGANSYAGGTAIRHGTLQLGDGGTGGSILGDVTNDGILAFNRSDTITFGGVISGTGGVHQIGTGATMLSADSASLSGLSRVDSGVLSVNGLLGGGMEVRGGYLRGNGRVGATIHGPAGIIAPGNSIGILTIDGNYVGNGGTLEIETALGDDSSDTDRLVITGDSSGTTNVRVINFGGSGGQTSEGIRIVEVGGASNGAFALLGDYLFQGEAAIIQGAYAYRLYQGGATTPLDGHWYLRSDISAPADPDDPTDPVEPTDPTDPTDPVEPVEPTDPTDPLDPVDPFDPVDPLDEICSKVGDA